MKRPRVEPATVEDIPLLLAMMAATKDNLFDPNVIGYKSTTTRKAVGETRTLAFMPHQAVFMLESLALHPDNSPRENAIAIAELVRTARDEARALGLGEIYHACREESTQQMALRHGFERFDYPMFRMKL